MSIRKQGASLLLAGASCSMLSHSTFAKVPLKPDDLRYPIASFDIANVRLGMTPDEVKTAMSKTDYVLAHTDYSKDFAGCVQYRAMERRGEFIGPRTEFSRGIGSQSYSGSSSQTISVQYGPSSSGQRVTSVIYSVQPDYMDEVTFFASLRKKYGIPSRYTLPSDGTSRSFTYCDTRDIRCDWDVQLPRLMGVGVTQADFKYWRIISLEQGKLAEKATLAAIEAAVDQTEPKVSRPQF